MTIIDVQQSAVTPVPSRSGQFDSGPLSWVMAEIRESLLRSKTALFEAGGREREERSTALQHARTHLHQAHGALVMVDIDGAALITLAAEQALDRFKDGTLEYHVGHAQIVAELYQALTEYLEDLLADAGAAAPQPLRLFPYYRALLTMLGAERIHPADLFFPPAPAHIEIPAPEQAAQADYPAYRQRFEKALLPFLKSTEADAQMAHAGALRDAIKLVADAQHEAPARHFWFAMQAFAELVAAGQLGSGLHASVYVKQLFGLINLQMRRLTQGTASQPDGMLRDALFFIAGASQPTPAAALLRDGYRLDGVLPDDYEVKRYGQIDQETLARAQRGLERAKAGWKRLAAAEIDAELDTAFEQSLAQVASAAEQLKVPALAALMRQVGIVAAKAVGAGRSPQLDAEIGTALLFAEHGLERLRRLPDDFAGNAETIAARLTALLAGQVPPAPPSGDLSRQIEQGQAVAALAEEMKTALREAEKTLDDYYIDPSRRAELKRVDPLMQQVQSALATLEQDHAWRAAQHINQAVRQLEQGAIEPAPQARALDEIAQNISALGFFVDMLGRNAAAAKGRFHFDESAGAFRAMPFEKIAAATPVPMLDHALPPAVLAEPAAIAALELDGGDELIDIFIIEARDVLAFIDSTLALPREQAGSLESLAMLRRSFHTLKGSSRMIGLAQFADAAGAIERVMNVWLAEGRPADDELFVLLDHATRKLAQWVAELAAGGSARTAAGLINAAETLLAGAAAPEPQPEPEAAAQPARPAHSGNVIGFPPATAPNEVRDDHLKHVGELQISLPLYNIYLAESDELLRLLTQDFGEWRHEPQRSVSDAALKAVHTLAGSSGTVGFAALRALAQALEAAIEAAVPPLNDAQHDVLEQATGRIRRMLQCFALGELAAPQPELIAALAGLHQPAQAPDLSARLEDLFASADDSIVGEAGPVEVKTEVEAVASPEAAVEAPAGIDDDAADALDALFAAAYADIVANPPASATAPVRHAAQAPAPDTSAVDDVFDSVFGLAPALEHAAPESASELAAEPAPEELHLEDSAGVLAVSAGLHDELDAELLSVFLEEGTDLMPKIGEALRTWQKNPHDVSQAQMLLRLLHTVKGSARMAGAMRLGQHAHEIETHIENMLHAGTATPQAFDELLAHYDHAQVLFEQLQQPLLDLADPEAEAPPEIKAALVRVRADILDQLVNQAGEVSISRSRMENEVGLLRSSMGEFSDNLARLRRQLREVEMQAESQIASRMAIASEREFDPLEFDRFTRLQELTRMMAESVNDVASFHENLTRSIDSSNDELVLQARLTRDLQRDLMQIRMVPFSSIAERLFRVARHSAKEVDKRVNLDIRGGAVELDRSVLERMAAPFEHLLRNAIAHGVETRAERGAAGKSETGEMLVQVSQQGNQVVIEFSDDGAGLDLERIRGKARQAGLIGAEAEPDDAQTIELIFTPGFSTADSLSELAGRGMGMDIVRSEVLALGGRVEIVSEPGQGARFTIHLPLTLAVTQVVLLSCAGRSYAVPSVLVEQVLHMKAGELAGAYAAGAVDAHEGPVALHYLANLLGESRALPQNQRHSPVLLLKNGHDRLALHVDEVQGNREVVIKNIGPQLARMPGIAGATVLGSGDIVLILNPVALVQHLAHHPELLQEYAAAAGDKDEPGQPRSSVMVVDDSLTVRRVMQRLLEREGYRVLLARDGIDALEQLQETVPALLLVDIEMPRMDGFDLTRNVRGDVRTRDVPIIMVTSRSADKHRNYALELGVNAYFGKPFQEDELLSEVGELIGGDLTQATP
ncbi:hybrid sensor histidine kinase/response regulator [Janthinobacterium agaricidamnosum]|uniref:Chemotaxis protein CheA n=1 Tax=Janthinobacterium agaricidamnosum NBRC 102515 = DSM 9628 TaxID=1349767 RepID=W0V0R5_9BURK|nr:Hpt domain-containing protein [Janthinobacterium agaricidamnosum]CDG81431.1 histidine kinase-, DNA gyrase B-, and HSP90-like ATPase family protein [Janthinobacterium agaricidamnosum NBRC 102515 = DSM 9628]